MHKSARWAGTVAVGLGLAATLGGAAAAVPARTTPRSTAAAPANAPQAGQTIRYYGFDVNNGTTDPGFIPVAGSNPKTYAQGDELIINDQLTTTRRTRHGYPIVGHDSGVCTLTRIPEAGARQTLANCVGTAVVTRGSLTLQGVVRFRGQQPEPAVLTVTGGTGRFNGATGTVAVSFTKNFKILTFKLR